MRKYLSLHFEITNKCNLRCKHCYNIDYLNGQHDDLTTNQCKAIINKAKSLGCKDFGFSGGEPLMREDIVELLEYVKEYPIHILTNGMLITQKFIDELLKRKIELIEFRISLDGLEGHKSLRNVDYKKVLESIQLLLKNGFVVTVNTMVSKESVIELMQMYELLKNIGVDRWRLDFIFNGGNAKLNKLVQPEKKVLFKALEEIIYKYVEERPNFELDVNKLFRSSYLEYAKEYVYTEETKPCEYQRSLTVRPTGAVSFCPSLSKTFGNILNDDNVCLFENDEMQSLDALKIKDLNETCLTCKYLKFCGGGCRADAYYSSGDLKGFYKYNCDLIEYYYENIRPNIEKFFCND